MSSRFAKFLLPLLALGLTTSCSDNENTDTPDNPVTEVRLESTLPAEGAVVSAAETGRIELTYNAGVTIDPNIQATLNGTNVRCVASGKVISLDVKLQPATDYTLVIPDRMVIGNKGLTYVGALTLKFSTEAIAEPARPEFTPLTNPSATQQARNVYDYICAVNGRQIISGAMANVNNNNDFADWIFKVTGRYPALTGYDFIHLASSAPGAWIDYADINAPRTQWNAGGLVSYMWHWNVPDSEQAWRDADTDRYGYNIGGDSNVTSFDIREALKEGTWQHDFILADIDKVAGYLKLLQDAGIPVIWRPLHEAAGSYEFGAWFWWGRYGDEPVKQLWKLMYDRLVKHHGLNNLIWVWTAQYDAAHADRMSASYPGDEYVDIVGVDIYSDNDDAHDDAYRAVLDMTSGHKPVTISECGRVLSPEKCLAAGADWSWFMIWYTYDLHKNPLAASDSFGNTAESLKAVMSSPLVVNRADIPSLK